MPETTVPAEFIVAAPVVPAIAATPAAHAGTPAATPATSTAAEGTPAADAPIGFPDKPVEPAVTLPPEQVVVYEKTGDAALDVALQFVGSKGFAPEHPAIKAATAGDFSVLEAELKKLGDKATGYEAYVNLAKDAFTRKTGEAKTNAEATAKVVHDAVGGPEKWAVIQQWASENADPSEKAQLNAAFKAGGLVARAAAKELAGIYAVATKNAPKGVVKATASAQPPVNGALMPREYAREVGALSAKLGNKMESSPEYAALQARRRAYRG